MRKRDKLKKMIGAIVGFSAKTPFSNSGELVQHVVLKIESVYQAKTNKEFFVKGIALKRLESNDKPEFRQYQISRIIDRTISIIGDNDWTKYEPNLIRLESGKAKKVEKQLVCSVDGNLFMENLAKIKERRSLCSQSAPSV